MRFTAFSIATLALIAPAAAPESGWVETVFPERAFDFGTVARGSKVRHTFRVVNTTNQEIHIANWRTKCGCTEVRVGSREIPPGTQTTIEAVIDTTKFQGYKASGLTLVLDKPVFMEVDLNLTCFIRSDVTLNPGLVDFGVVPRHAKPTATLMLHYAGGQPTWGVTKMQTVSRFVSAKLRELSRTPDGQVQYELTATLDPETPSGFFKDEITLFTNDSGSPKIPISVVANVQAAVTVSPSILNLGRVRPGNVVKKTVLVRAARPFKVTEVKPSKPELSPSAVPDEAKPVHNLTLTFQAPNRPGPYNAVVEVATDLKDEPAAKVTAFATVVP
jgi:hypothetical protein